MLLREVSFRITKQEVVGIYKVNRQVGQKLSQLAEGLDLEIARIGDKIYVDSKYAVNRVWKTGPGTFAEFVMPRDVETTDEEAETRWWALVEADLENAGWER